MIRLLTSAALGSVLIVALPWPSEAGFLIKVGNGKAASCTEAALRTALALADTQGGGAIYFRCGSGPVAISVSELLVVPDHTIIDGGGLITLRGLKGNATPSTVMSVAADSTAVFTGLGIANGLRVIRNEGTLRVHNSTVTAGVFGSILNSGTLTVSNSTLIAGAGIVNGGALLVHDSTFSSNIGRPFGGSLPFGGAIYNVGTAVVNNSTFIGNEFEEGLGGAIANSGTMVLRNSVIEDSEAFRGGGIYNEGTLTVSLSRISGGFAGLGGGIFNAGELVITNSVVASNTALTAGGGIYTCCGGRTTLLRTSVTGNSPDNVLNVPGP